MRHDDRTSRREIVFGEVRRVAKSAGVHVKHAEAAAAQVGVAIARICNLRSVRAALQLRVRIAELNAKGARGSVEGIGQQDVDGRRPFFAQIAIVGFNRSCEVQAGIVQRLARDQVDQASDLAFDHVRCSVLEHFDTANQFGRHVFESKAAATGRREDITAVQFRTDIGQAANDHARAFYREAVRVGSFLEPADVNAGNALQCFCYRAVGQRANVFCSDDINDRVGTLLDVLGGFQRLGKAGNDDDVFFVQSLGCAAGRLLNCDIFIVRILSEGRLRRDEREARCGCECGDTARRRTEASRFQKHKSSQIPSNMSGRILQSICNISLLVSVHKL